MPNPGRLSSFLGLAACALLFLIAASAAAREDFPGRIPNGGVNSCDNCHLDAANDDYRRTDFGDDFKDAGSGWSGSLAAADSDGDLVTNGWELQDPDGSWQAGQPAPGISSLVTLPGDILSIPPTILLDTDLLLHEEDAGANGASFFTVDNAGGLVLAYEAGDDQAWMSLDPVNGMLAPADPAEQIDVFFDSLGLVPDVYYGTITVSAAGIRNSPQTIAVELTVLPEPAATTLGLSALAGLALLAPRRGRG